MDALTRAIQCFDSQAALARALDVVPMTVSQWKRRGQVPIERCRAIETATNGSVTVHDLRPDIFGPAEREAA